MDYQETLTTQNNLEKEDKVGGLTLPDFKPYYKAAEVTIFW